MEAFVNELWEKMKELNEKDLKLSLKGDGIKIRRFSECLVFSIKTRGGINEEALKEMKEVFSAEKIGVSRNKGENLRINLQFPLKED